ncbi:hypothetical protein QRD43_13465 [Pelomonas sp. APW6]|uniref:DUF2125 domain-containing protein n=1 Tax=Roseateles subflavus TaxID=3053353 RepID=A0ABT7LJ75_9BURK|nr:hypothetical protein [Pelomonas sp. APW6]MDL5032918.1 hypothetical protein [Pelomonas sp. APW6]
MSHTPLRRLVPAACLSLALAPALALADDAPVTMNLMPLPGTQQQHDFRIKAVTDMKFKAREGASDEEIQQINAKMGAVKMPMTMTLQMSQRLQAGKKDAQGHIPVTARIEYGTMEMRMGDGDLVPGMPAKRMPSMQFNADIIDGRYENIRLSGEGAAQLPPQMMEGVFRKTFDALAQMNGTPLRVGESVEMPLEMNVPLPSLPGGSNAGKMSARYTLTKVEAGVAYFDIGATMDFKLDLPMPAAAASAASAASAAGDAAPAPASLQLVMTGSGTGHLQLRLADRLQQRTDLDLRMDMRMPMPDGHSMQMNLQMDMAGVGKALPAGPAKPTSKPASKPATTPASPTAKSAGDKAKAAK